MQGRLIKLFAAAAATIGGGGALVLAQTAGTNQPVFVWNHGDLTLTGNAIVSAASVNTLRAGFGTGSFRTDGTRISTNIWALEGFAKPQLAALYDPGPYGLYGRVSAALGTTLTGGDAYFPYNTTRNRPTRIDLEEAVVGVRSGTSFLDWGIGVNPDIFDLSVGNQDFVLGDGFLIQQGGTNGGKRGAYWDGLRTAFKDTALLRINTQPVRFDVFTVTTNASQRDAYYPYVGSYPTTSIAGVNVEYYKDSTKDGVLSKDWSYGLSFLHVYGSDVESSFAAATGGAPDNGGVVPGSSTGATRAGMNVFDVRVQGALIRSLPQLFLSGEYVYENNPHTGLTDNGYERHLDANAGYAEAAWQFSGALKPKLGARYAHFSGTRSGATASGAFDPLAYGYSYAPSRNTYGTWIMGEIVGEYYLFNTNQNVAMLYGSMAATPEITLSAFAYDFRFDHPPAPTVTSREAFQELDLEVDYYPTRHPWLGITGILGAAHAGAGGKQYINSVVSGTAANPADVRNAGSWQGLALLTAQATF